MEAVCERRVNEAKLEIRWEKICLRAIPSPASWHEYDVQMTVRKTTEARLSSEGVSRHTELLPTLEIRNMAVMLCLSIPGN